MFENVSCEVDGLRSDSLEMYPSALTGQLSILYDEPTQGAQGYTGTIMPGVHLIGPYIYSVRIPQV